MRSKLLSGIITMAMAMDAVTGKRTSSSYEEVEKRPKKKVIPKGTKQYYFNSRGIVSFSRNEDTVFECIASSDRVAIQKFNKSFES